MKKIAIYSRKSKFTGKGESIENQIIKCKKFIEFQFDITDNTQIEIFIDEGFSGKNENRPAYQEMLDKIKNKEIDKIVLYQLNRLGRNARDIHNTMEICNSLDSVIFSATEGFDSSTHFGRALIGILASLAQLEREQLAERVKDNMYTLAKMGRWLGGQSPLGYDGIKEIYIDETMKERTLSKLKINKVELELVKSIFNKYLETKSLSQVEKWALQNNLRGKNGANLQKTTINSILQNTVYVKSDTEVFDYLSKNNFEVCGVSNGNGILRYGKKDRIASVGKHKGIISSEEWIKVQELLKENAAKAPRIGKTHTAILTGVLRCSCGSNMRIAYGGINVETGRKRYYYVCAMKSASGKVRCDSKNLPGAFVENLVIDKIKNYNKESIEAEVEKILNEVNKVTMEVNTEVLQENIKNNNIQIERLLKKLALVDDEDITKLILTQIKTLKDKNKELNIKIKELLESESSLILTQQELNEIINKIEDFNLSFDDFDFDAKKAAINELIENINYDSKNQSIAITYKFKKK